MGDSSFYTEGDSSFYRQGPDPAFEELDGGSRRRSSGGGGGGGGSGRGGCGCGLLFGLVVLGCAGMLILGSLVEEINPVLKRLGLGPAPVKARIVDARGPDTCVILRDGRKPNGVSDEYFSASGPAFESCRKYKGAHVLIQLDPVGLKIESVEPIA